jgi:protoheme IX farnesyltransferase
MIQWRGDFGAHIGLCRVRIALFSSLSAATGFIIAKPGPGPGIFPLMLGIFILACGASALNQYQERGTDALMPRTAGRPIPSGKITPLAALCFSVGLIAVGVFALLPTGSILAPLLGLTGVLWYNGLYTFMKRKTAFAAVPGALVGTVTPAAGWVSGGGELSDPGIAALCFFFFLWQIPHFWLLVLSHGEEYEKAGLPSLTGIFTRAQLLRIIFIWISSAAVSCLFISMSGVVRTPLVNILLFGASFWLVVSAVGLQVPGREEIHYSFAFRKINVYVFLVMALLSVDRLFL